MSEAGKESLLRDRMFIRLTLFRPSTRRRDVARCRAGLLPPRRESTARKNKHEENAGMLAPRQPTKGHRQRWYSPQCHFASAVSGVSRRATRPLVSAAEVRQKSSRRRCSRYRVSPGYLGRGRSRAWDARRACGRPLVSSRRPPDLSGAAVMGECEFCKKTPTSFEHFRLGQNGWCPLQSA